MARRDHTIISLLRRLRPTGEDLAAVVALQDPRPLLELRRHRLAR